jgi:hypothetical protein
MHAMKSGTPGSGRSGFPSETFREDPLLLAGCWHEFVGAESQRMHAGKLGRMEDVRWEPPVLSFRIERHGAMGVGSTRAELQNWRVDLDRKTPNANAAAAIARRCRARKESGQNPSQGNLPRA